MNLSIIGNENRKYIERGDSIDHIFNLIEREY